MKKSIKHMFYSIAHPMSGYYEVRHENKGNALLAVIIVLLFGISFSVNRQYASFIVNDINPLSVNSLMEVLSVVALYLLFCIGNWSITCLLDGEGRFVDILTVTGYSMLPMVLAFTPLTVFSYLIAENEEAFYYVLMALSILYFIILEIMGIMIVHNFTIGKTFAIILLTILAMFVILFLILLLYSVIQQIIGFFVGIYDEFMLRA